MIDDYTKGSDHRLEFLKETQRKTPNSAEKRSDSEKIIKKKAYRNIEE